MTFPSSTTQGADFLAFWGKARPDPGDGTSWHPIAYHCLDVAAVTGRLLEVRPLARRRVAALLGLTEPEATTMLVALAALHDLGKFAPAFQVKSRDHWPRAVLGAWSEAYAVPRPHTEDGIVLWQCELSLHLSHRLWTDGLGVLDVLAPGVFGHHGRPVQVGQHVDSPRARFRTAGLGAAAACADAMVSLLAPEPCRATPVPPERARIASWVVSGLVTVADWVGSNQRWFEYAPPDPDDATLAGYWERAQSIAERAVREAGLEPCLPSVERSFRDVARVPGDPTPVQQWASTVTLSADPALFVIEDVTGAGKTEAAQMLVHRLMAAGHAAGAYWAMPTMATANAMYARQVQTIGALFTDGARPSLALAHGQQALHEGFRSTVLFEPARVSLGGESADHDLESTVACAAFLADDRRAAFLADVGAGTVDQALLGVLPSRFNTVRLFGLADKVLVVDEAHAYDAYMAVEVQWLLRFQAALGGYAVVLSATLSGKQRRELAEAWAEGAHLGGAPGAGSALMLTSAAYPLATVVTADSPPTETALEAASWSHRTLPVRFLHTMDDALHHVIDARARGADVAWVRNTVDDCLEAAARLREQGLEPMVFHARFAQGDRQSREREVMACFGRDASRRDPRGRVLVATQVIEQSLDLDFDVMVSDVAPVDLLVQRAGRLWRHATRTKTGRPAGASETLVVLAPVPSDDPSSEWLDGIFAGTAAVYENPGVLWRTVKALHDRGCIEAPGGLRGLIGSVYDSDEVPDALSEKTQRAEGEQGAHKAAATYGVLRPREGYHATAKSWLHDLRVPTRLGDARTTVRLARVGAGGALEPWVLAEGPPWKAWALSEVSVSAKRVPPTCTVDPRFAEAVVRVRAGWGAFDQEILILPLEATTPGEWTGRLVAPGRKGQRGFRYSIELGLAFHEPDP